MSLYYRYNENFITLTGQTYTHRAAIKALGGQFVGDRKVWKLPFSQENLSRVDLLCKQNSGGPSPLMAMMEGASDSPLTPLLSPERPGPGIPAGLDSSRALEFSSPQTFSSTKFSEILAVEGPVVAQLERGTQDDRDTEKEKALGVSELMQICEGVFSSTFPIPLWIFGELQNVQDKGARGTLYFDLSEPDSRGVEGSSLSVSCVLWRDVFKKLLKKYGEPALAGVLQDGMKVKVLCQVNFYRRRGTLSLAVQDLDLRYTKGALALAREQLLADLRKKGLATANKSLKLPSFLFRIGLISADGSRALSDFQHQLQERHFCGEIIYVHAAMQGDKCPGEVRNAILMLEQEACDLIVLTRGGGSAADLRWFDSSEIAYTIAACRIPILAAIGHHDDFCIAEEIAFERRKTPTAAADFITESFVAVHKRLDDAQVLFARLLKRKYNELMDRQALLMARLRGLTSLEKPAAYLNKLSDRLVYLASMQVAQQKNHIMKIEGQLSSHDPRPWIRQGWTQLWNQAGPVKVLSQLEVGDSLQARLIDGVVSLKVEGKE
ncbi:MAG: exodeoxyribonuclease VII large subunit [Oligoflexales bacterium]|nr:exodeoxyribonuclease VII large subunit [Oligoflexales bacterium]